MHDFAHFYLNLAKLQAQDLFFFATPLSEDTYVMTFYVKAVNQREIVDTQLLNVCCDDVTPHKPNLQKAWVILKYDKLLRLQVHKILEGLIKKKSKHLSSF